MALAARAQPRPLRVVTFNVHGGADVDALAAAFTQHPELSRAGLILLQEEESHPDEGASRPARLAAALGMAHVYAPAREVDGFTTGLAILSAFPLDAVETMELPHADLGASTYRRIALAADLVVGATRLRVVNVHLDTLMNVTDRILQLRPAVIDAPDPVLVGGDFNTNDWVWVESGLPLFPTHAAADTSQAPILDSYLRALGFATQCEGVGVTESLAGLGFRLDGVFTRGVAAGTGQVARDVDLSDHWPVWVDVTLP